MLISNNSISWKRHSLSIIGEAVPQVLHLSVLIDIMSMNTIFKSEKLLQWYYFLYYILNILKLRISSSLHWPLFLHMYFILSHSMQQKEFKHWAESFLFGLTVLFPIPQSLSCRPRFWSPAHKSIKQFERRVYQVMMEIDLLSLNKPKLSEYTKHSDWTKQTLANQGVSIGRLLLNYQYPYNLNNWNILRNNVFHYHNYEL